MTAVGPQTPYLDALTGLLTEYAKTSGSSYIARAPRDVLRFFVGPNCLPIAAAREQLDNVGLGSFNAAIDGLLVRAGDFRHIYGAAAACDPVVKTNSEAAVKGLLYAIRAARIAPGKGALDTNAVSKAISDFTKAWYPSATCSCHRARSQHTDDSSGLFQEYSKAASECCDNVFWLVLDIIDRLRPADPARRPDRAEVSSAVMPLLLYGKNDVGRAGQVARLEVDVLQDGGSGFAPDPLGMGLTFLWTGNQKGNDASRDIITAMQRAWDASQLASLGFRGRWRVLPGNDGQSIPWLEGRSAEAACCCALWAAAGVVPGSDEFVRFQIDPGRFELHPEIAISACIDDSRAAADQTGPKARLSVVTGLVEKLEAAKKSKSGVSMVLVAEGQERIDRLASGNPQFKYSMETDECATLGDAFRQLIELQYILRRHRESTIKEWIEQWEPGTADLGEAPQESAAAQE